MFKDLFKSKEEKELTSKPQVLDCAMQPIISKDNICVKIAYAICYISICRGYILKIPF